MMRLTAVVLTRDERSVLRGLGRLGAIHLSRTPSGPDTAPIAPPSNEKELARCDDILRRIPNLCRTLGLDESAGPDTEPPEMSLDQAEGLLHSLESRSRELSQELRRIEKRWDSVSSALEKISGYQGLGLPLDRLGQSIFLHFAMGSLPEGRLRFLEEQLRDNVILLPLAGSGEEWNRVVAVTSRKGRFALETALEQSGFRRETPTKLGTEAAEELLETSRQEQDRLSEERTKSENAMAELAREARQPLEELERRARIERAVLHAQQNFPHTESTVMIAGWVPAEDVTALERELRRITGGRCFVEAERPDAVPDIEIPVLLRHPRLLRPFEMLVAGYGLPGYRELEPTLFVAVTYVLMFGMMFGDVGHGAILAIGGLAALTRGRTNQIRDVGLLLVFSGLSSALFGAVYGSYFGITELKRLALWRDPLEGSPIHLMVAAIATGIGIISIGLVLNMVNLFRRGDWVGGFLDKFGVAGALFYWGVIALTLKYAALRERGLLTLAGVLLVALPWVALSLKEPVRYALDRRAGRVPEEGLARSLIESVLETFEAAIGYMANTISFVRLAAYAMSHAAILMAAFVVAAEIKSLSVGGSALSLLAIIVGNLVALLLEGVVASVQALRLEYYEFFGKFFSGSGKPFRPFRI